MRVIGLLLFALSLAFAPFASAAERAGYIESWSPQDEGKGPLIVRGNETIAPAAMMPVFAGDIVKLPAAGSFIVIMRTDDTPLEIEGPLEKILDAVPEKGVVTSLMEWTWSIVGSGKGEETPPNLVSKGSGPYVAAAPAGGTVVRGPEPVFLAWHGGMAPYRIRVGDTVLNSAEPKISFSLPEEYKRRVEIEISDADGASTRVTLRLANAAPALPAEIASLQASDAFRKTAAAAWLAQQQGGKWRLEAMRQLHALKDYEPARRLLAALAAGKTVAR